MTMRVLMNTWRDTIHPRAGGAEVVTDTLASGLTHRGHEVTLRCGGPITDHDYATVSGGGTYSQYLRTPGFHIANAHRFDVAVDIAHGMSHFTPLFDPWIPTATIVHHDHHEQWGMYFPWPIAAAGRAMERHLAPRVYQRSMVVSVSPSTTDSLIRLGVEPERIRTLPAAVALDHGHHPRSGTPLFLSLGRITAHKRLDLLLRMWEQVRPHTGGRLVIAGDGPDRDAIAALAGPGVELPGRISDQEKAALLGSAWLLVHPAAHEGWGLVISEAALAGTPALGFDVPGVRDAIIHGSTGLVAGDEQAFVRSWIALASDPHLRVQLGTEAARVAATYSVERRIDHFEAILAETIERRGRAGHLRCVREPVAPVRLGRGPGPVSRSLPLSLVIPAFNEADRIGPLLDAVASRLDSATEVVVVDDGSSDGTAEVVARHLRAMPRGRLLHLDRNRGKGAALRAGVAVARGEAVVTMDADLATDLAALDPVLDRLAEVDVAIGSRCAPGATVLGVERRRQIMGWGFNLLARSATGLGLRDTQCGFKAFRGPAARLLFHLATIDGFAQDVEILDLATRLGLTVAEVPVRWTAMEGSKVRPVRHSVEMSASVCRLALRRTGPVPPVAALHLACGDRPTAIAAKEVRSVIRATDPLLSGPGRITILVPGAGPGALDALATRIGDETGLSAEVGALGAGSLLRRRTGRRVA